MLLTDDDAVHWNVSSTVIVRSKSFPPVSLLLTQLTMRVKSARSFGSLTFVQGTLWPNVCLDSSHKCGSRSRHTTAQDNLPNLACSATRVNLAAWVHQICSLSILIKVLSGHLPVLFVSSVFSDLLDLCHYVVFFIYFFWCLCLLPFMCFVLSFSICFPSMDS